MPYKVRVRPLFPRRKSFDSRIRRRTPEEFAPSPPQCTVIEPRSREKKEVFRHLKKIGEGGQGRCDLYKREADGKLFVYKTMKYPIDYTDWRGERKPKEAAILQDILTPYPRLIKLYHWIKTGPSETAFYMEFCSGGDLHGLIDQYHEHNEEIPESFVWHVYLQLAEALAWLQEGYDSHHPRARPPRDHECVVHRDIKPANVFLRKSTSGSDQYPEIVLADFGIATTHQKTCERSFLGTMAYQPPELPLHSIEGDVWAIGACVHHMCIGVPPISKAPSGFPRNDWYYRREARKVVDVTKIGYSEELRYGLLASLAFERKDRYTGKELVDALDRDCRKARVRRIPLASWALPR